MFANVDTPYADGASISSVLDTSCFRSIRVWQEEYLRDDDTVRNLFRLCPIRNHYQFAWETIQSHSLWTWRQPALLWTRVPPQDVRVRRPGGRAPRSPTMGEGDLRVRKSTTGAGRIALRVKQFEIDFPQQGDELTLRERRSSAIDRARGARLAIDQAEVSLPEYRCRS